MRTASSSRYVELRAGGYCKAFKGNICGASLQKLVTQTTFLFLPEQNPADGSWEDPALEKLHLFCEESRSLNDWVPEISLPGR